MDKGSESEQGRHDLPLIRVAAFLYYSVFTKSLKIRVNGSPAPSLCGIDTVALDQKADTGLFHVTLLSVNPLVGKVSGHPKVLPLSGVRRWLP